MILVKLFTFLQTNFIKTMKNLRYLISLFLITTLSIGLNAQSNFQFQKRPLVCKGHRTSVNDVIFSPDGNVLYSCGGSNQIIAFDANNGNKLRSVNDNSNINCIAINKDGSMLVSGGYVNPNVNIYTTSNLTLKTSIQDFESVEDICFSPTNNYFVVVGVTKSDGKYAIIIYDADNQEKAKQIYKQGNTNSLPTCLAFSPDGKYIASGVANSAQGIYIYDVSTRQQIMYIAHTSAIDALQFSPDGQYIAGGGIDNNVHIWRLKDGGLVKTLTGLYGYINSIDYTPNGYYIAATGMDHSCVFKMWDINTGQIIQSMDQKGPDINSLCFSPDGQSLAVGLRTYGDLFEVTTTAIYKTTSTIENEIWYPIASSMPNIRLEFPNQPTEAFFEDQYYKYYDFSLQHSGQVYQVRTTKYLYNVTSSKRTESTNKNANKYRADLTNVVQNKFTLGGEEGIDLVGYDGDLRYHYRFVFIGDTEYYLLFMSRNDEESMEETRFFNSFSQY